MYKFNLGAAALLAIVAIMPATASPIAAEALNSTVTPLISDKEVAVVWMREMFLEDAVVKGFARIEWETLIPSEELSSLKKGPWTSAWGCYLITGGE
jgi:hypothetical protein